MSFDLPAIDASSDSAPEISAHGMDGYLIQPGDVASLQAHLVDLAHNRQKLAAMGVSASQRFEAWTVKRRQQIEAAELVHIAHPLGFVGTLTAKQ